MHHITNEAQQLTSGIPALHDIPAPATTKIFLYIPSRNDSTIFSNVIFSAAAENNFRSF